MHFRKNPAAFLLLVLLSFDLVVSFRLLDQAQPENLTMNSEGVLKAVRGPFTLENWIITIAFVGLHALLVYLFWKSTRLVDSGASIEKHRRWTIVAGVGFLVTAFLIVPFLRGNTWQSYWIKAGQYLLLLCLLFCILFIFEAVFTWGLWSTKKHIDRGRELSHAQTGLKPPE